MAEPFGAVGSEIWRAKRFRPLADFERTVYLYIHACPHRSPIGLFRLPMAFLADDIDRDLGDCKAAIEVLRGLQLIDYDGTENLLLVNDWEKRNAPDGPLESIGRIQKNFDKAPHHEFTIRAFIRFTHDILHKAQGTHKGGDGWNHTDSRTKMEGMIFHRLRNWTISDFQMVLAAFKSAKIDPADRVFDMLTQQLPDDLRDTLLDTHSIPTRNKDIDTDRDIDNDRDNDRDRDRDRDTRARGRDESAPAPSSPPPKGGRSGRSKTPPDVQKKIDSLTKGAKAK